MGLDLMTGEPMLPEQEGVWDNYCVKRQSLHLSTVSVFFRKTIPPREKSASLASLAPYSLHAVGWGQQGAGTESPRAVESVLWFEASIWFTARHGARRGEARVAAGCSPMLRHILVRCSWIEFQRKS